MGDTIVKVIKDFTLWIGDITILPGEQGVRFVIKYGVQKVIFFIVNL
jgi:potassium channel subfamily K